MKRWNKVIFRQQIGKPSQCAGRSTKLSTASDDQRSAISLHGALIPYASITPPRSEPCLRQTRRRQLRRPRHMINFSTTSIAAAAAAAATTTVTASPPNYQENLFIKHRNHKGNESEIILDSLLVRDSCRCRQCVDPSSQQKLFQTADIPTSIAGCIENKHSQADSNTTAGTDDIDKVVATISWLNDVPGYPAEHKTELTAEMLASMAVLSSSASSHPRSSSLTGASERAKDTRIPWKAADMARAVQWFDYDRYMRSDETLFAVIEALRIYGLAFIRGVPDFVPKGSTQSGETITVECIAERIGSLRNSFYGRSWDVRSVPGATNVAYTHQYLGMHMDLLYMANPPRLQLLHCLHATSSGGVSLFSDTLAAANAIRNSSPAEEFSALTSFPVPYHYRNAGQHYRSARPTIELGVAPLDFDLGDTYESYSNKSNAIPTTPSFNSATLASSKAATTTTTTTATAKDDSLLISHTNYSPPFQAPFYSPSTTTYFATDSSIPSSSSPLSASSSSLSPVRHPTDLRAYHKSLKSFTALLEHPSSIYKHRLAEGELVIFDNRRVAHARTAFEVGIGERWLKGAYVDGDVWVSRWRGLKEKLSRGREER